MITELRVRGWRCLRDVTLALTPLHALIGPNDSGKSTLLDALWRARTPAVPDAPDAAFELRTGRVVLRSQAGTPAFSGEYRNEPFRGMHPPPQVVDELGTARRMRLEAAQLRQACQLVDRDDVGLSERGDNLAGVYDWILNRDRDAWDKIEASVRAGFPTVRRLALKAVTTSSKVIEVELADKTRVPADQLSEGLLYWLAFACLPHVSPTSLVLIEEPENGLHPARIRDVVRVLRKLSEAGTQVVLATHSPLVVNELEPEQVSVVTRTAESGTRVRRVSDVPGLERLRSAFSLGELWLAYADGKDEAGLFAPEQAP